MLTGNYPSPTAARRHVRHTVTVRPASTPSGEIIANLGLQKQGYFVTTLHKSEIELERSSLKWLEWLRPELYTVN